MSYDEAQTHLGRLTVLCGTNSYGAKAIQFFNLQTERITELEKELADLKAIEETRHHLRSLLVVAKAQRLIALNERDAAKTEAATLREALEDLLETWKRGDDLSDDVDYAIRALSVPVAAPANASTEKAHE